MPATSPTRTSDWERVGQFINRAVERDSVADGDPWSERALARRKMMIKDGLIFKEAASGAMIPLADATVLDRSDPATASARHTLSTSYELAWSAWLRESLIPGVVGQAALSRLSSPMRNALVEGTDSQGGYATPPTFATEILSRAVALSTVRQRAHIIPVASDRLIVPAVAPASADSDIFTSSWRAAWAPEVSTTAGDDPQFQQFELGVKKLKLPLLRLSNDLIADAPAALGWIVDRGSEALALSEDSGFLAGDGLSLEPRGILESGVSEMDIEGTTVQTVSNTSVNAGSFTKLQALVSDLPAQYRQNATMIASPSAEAGIASLVDAVGRPMYSRGSCEGAPLRISPFLETQAADARVLVYGDWSAYLIAQRGLILNILFERFADTFEVGVALFERVGGGCWNPGAFRIGKV